LAVYFLNERDLGVSDFPATELAGRLAEDGVAGLEPGVVGLEPGVVGLDPGVNSLLADFGRPLEPGVPGAGRFAPATRAGAGTPSRDGVGAKPPEGLLLVPAIGDATFPAVLVLSGVPGDFGAISVDDPAGERPTTPDFAPPEATIPGERAMMAPRDAAAAGDRVKFSVEEALR